MPPGSRSGPSPPSSQPLLVLTHHLFSQPRNPPSAHKSLPHLPTWPRADFQPIPAQFLMRSSIQQADSRAGIRQGQEVCVLWSSDQCSQCGNNGLDNLQNMSASIQSPADDIPPAALTLPRKKISLAPKLHQHEEDLSLPLRRRLIPKQFSFLHSIDEVLTFLPCNIISYEQPCDVLQRAILSPPS